MSTAPPSLAQEKPLLVSVLVPQNPDRFFDYLLPPSLHETAKPGLWVKIPFGRKTLAGLIWTGPFDRDISPVSDEKLRSVVALYDESPPLSDGLRRFIKRMADYSLNSKGRILKLILPHEALLDEARPPPGVKISPSWQQDKKTPRQKDILEQLEKINIGQTVLSKQSLCQQTGASPQTVKRMINQNLLLEAPLPADIPPIPDPDYQQTILTNAQQKACDNILTKMAENRFSALLLDGETGSGKTEIYFEAVANCLREKRQCLILLPEIALSTQFITRFQNRFGVSPLLWHSALSQKERRQTWHSANQGKPCVIVGARSALFLPLPAPGLIIVDEEQASAYRQEETPLYNGRDMAVLRADSEQIPIILASATPSLESLVNAETGRYHHIRISQRFGGASLPDIDIIDLKKNPAPKKQWISPILREKINENLEKKNQTLLFLNRRGYAPLLLCQACGFRLQCPDCTAWLVEHRYSGHLACHHCGHKASKPDSCPQCKKPESLIACGPGVERIAEEARKLFPEARLAILTADHMDKPEKTRKLITDIEDHLVDILIGTQIIAKGFHFPKLTLAGIIDADMGLEGGDIRACEHSYQLLHQLSGRVGRDKNHKGIALLQSFEAQNPVLQALKSGRREDFIEVEKKRREKAGWPPFGRIATLILSSPDHGKLVHHCHRMKQNAPPIKGITVLGPAPATLAIIRNRHRQKFLLKTSRDQNLQFFLKKWIAENPPPAAIRVKIDIDGWSYL